MSEKGKNKDEIPKLDGAADKKWEPRPTFTHWSDCFLNMDIYGVSPQLEIRGKKQVRSCWGAFISFIVYLLVAIYFAYRILYFIQGFPLVRIYLDIMGEMTGIELNEEVDLQLEFTKDPTQYQYGNWSLVQMETVGEGEAVKQILYLQTVKRTSPYLKYSDAASDVGGFYVFISFVLGGLVNCINQKLFLKKLVHDSYKMHYDKDYLRIPDPNAQPSRFSIASKKKETHQQIDEEKDKGGFDDKSAKSGKSGKKKKDEKEGGSEELETERQFLSQSDLHYDGGKDDDVRSQGSRKSGKSQQSGKSGKNKSSKSKKTSSKNQDDDAKSSKSRASNKSKTSKQQTPGKNKEQSYETPRGISTIEDQYLPIELSLGHMILLNWTMPCCRSQYQKSLATLLKKLESKLHRELDIGPHLRKIRDNHNYAKSFATSEVFDKKSLILDYENEYTNVVNISIDTEESVVREYDDPKPIQYVSPAPYCVCPDLGEENLIKITETAYKILKGEIKLTQELEKQVTDDRKRRNTTQKEGGEAEEQGSSWFETDNNGKRNKKVSKSLSPKRRVVRKIQN